MSVPLKSTPHLLGNLKHQQVRDLAWCCLSSPMMAQLPGSEAHILPFDNHTLMSWIHQLDQQPQPLLEHLHALKSTRLGIYYESLWQFYFESHPDWELLNHNLQIDRHGITLGAFDFLCRRGDEYWHIETALKFYLCNTSDASAALDWQYWIGPTGQDRLDLKLNHLRDHQLPLHEKPEASAMLSTLYPDAKFWNTGLCLQGYLFAPVQQHLQPGFSHAQHGSGEWWFAQRFLDNLSAEPAMQCWHLLERSQWLSPARVENQNQLLGNPELAKIIREEMKSGRPLLIAQMESVSDASMAHSCWIEALRLFVVPDDWPTQSDRPAIASPARNT